jgi:hypothetical protein
MTRRDREEEADPSGRLADEAVVGPRAAAGPAAQAHGGLLSCTRRGIPRDRPSRAGRRPGTGPASQLLVHIPSAANPGLRYGKNYFFRTAPGGLWHWGDVRCALLILGCGALVTAPAREDETIYYFFSPEAPGPDSARACAARRGEVRPCLLVTDWRRPIETTPEFLETIRILTARRPVDVYDLEAVTLARRFGVRKLPAIVIVRGREIQIFYGSAWKEVGP